MSGVIVYDVATGVVLDPAGESAVPASDPANNPQRVVTMRQARRALLAAGLLGSVQAALDALPEPQRSQALIDWEYSSAVYRENGFVALLAPALGLSAAQVDALFEAAAGYAP